MKYHLITICSLMLYTLVNIIPNFAIAQKAVKKRVYVFSLHEEIAPGASRLVSKAFQEAQRQEVDYILLQLNTFGGQLDAADSIRTIIDCLRQHIYEKRFHHWCGFGGKSKW
jgi:membrane-bound ClpP family serine protease